MAGGVAVVAAAAVLGPTVLRSELSAPPIAAQTPHYNVTVSPPAQDATPGVIATGSINGWHWQATLSRDRRAMSWRDFGPSFGYFQIGSQVPLGGEFAAFDSEGRAPGPPSASPTSVRRPQTVRYLTVTSAERRRR